MLNAPVPGMTAKAAAPFSEADEADSFMSAMNTLGQP